MDNCIIILVVFVIATSYLFKLKWSDSSTQQLLYVFLGLLLIIIFNSYNKEGFVSNNSNNVTINKSDTDTVVTPPSNWSDIETVTSDNFTGIKKIVAYLKGLNETDVNKVETQKLVTDLSAQFNKFEPSKLEYQLSQITTLLNNLQNVSSLTTTPEAKESSEENILESKSIKESQFLQDIEINKLESELSELQKLYDNFKDKEAKKVFKKIPVYSSCVMEANGSMSKNDPKNIAFETAENIKSKREIITGQSEDPNATPIDKLLQAINQGGVNISLQSTA